MGGKGELNEAKKRGSTLSCKVPRAHNAGQDQSQTVNGHSKLDEQDLIWNAKLPIVRHNMHELINVG